MVDLPGARHGGAGDETERDDQSRKVRGLAQRCAEHAEADTGRAMGQLATTLVPFLALVALMLLNVGDNLWLTLLLAIPAGGLLIRLFIIQHDCGHVAFLPTRAGNDLVGRFVSVFTMTPYGLWKREHALHHASSGNLDRRGVGDIDTLTVAEYRALPGLQKLRYRIYRNPLFLFPIGIPLYFMLLQRFPWRHGLPVRDTWKSVLGLDIAMLVVYGALVYVFGIAAVAIVVVPIVVLASAAGGWLFFIQHQFEGTYWEHTGDWDKQVAAVKGSSFYDLPAIVNWFTGDIGLHHIHHLNSRIPNYRLRQCLEAIPEFKSINRLTLIDSLKCVRLKLWDEDRHQLVGFADIR